jgi:ribosomal protein S18 acetylase RimI-like enzyme
MDYQLDNKYTDNDKARVKAGFAAYSEDKIGVSRRFKDWVVRGEDGLCIGHLQMMIVGKDGYIKSLWVDESHRGEGLAKFLMNAAEDFAVENGFNQIWVDTYSYQAPEFYKAYGFVLECEIPEYQKTHSRIFLRKNLC